MNRSFTKRKTHQYGGATVTAVSRGGSDVLRGDYCTDTSEFMFSVKLPQEIMRNDKIRFCKL
jgi:hypothetical protein